MNKWTKIKCNLFWHLQEIDLRQKVDGDFQFSFTRGDSKGESDVMKPDLQNKLIFNATYEVPCTMYIDKSDGSVRPKKLKVTLKRIITPSKTKIFGKLSINVGDFYGNNGEISINKEMESGRGTPPVFIARFQLQPISDAVEAGKADMNDLSFLGEQEKHVPLKDWDVNDTPNQDDEEEDGDDEKKKPKKKKLGFRKSKKLDKKKSKNDLKTENDQPTPTEKDAFDNLDEIETAPKLVFQKEAPSNSEVSFTKESENQQETTPIEITETPSSEVTIEQNDETPKEDEEETPKKSDKKQKKKAAKTDNDDDKPKSKKKESKKKGDKKKGDEHKPSTKGNSSSSDDEDDTNAVDTPEAKNERKKDEELMNMSPEYFFHVILSQDWTHLKLCNPHFIKQSSLTILLDAANVSGKPCFPAAFFPLIATFSETHFLDENDDDHFQSELSVFVAEYPIMPNMTISTRLQLTILLYAFVYDMMNNDHPLFKFSKKKCQAFLNNLLTILEKQCDDYLLKYANRTEVLVNRFATANFEFDHLLADFKQVIRKAMTTFDTFGSIGMNKILKTRYLDLFETKILNKIIESPNRFTFTNSAIWNSFISAVENDERISLGHIKEAVSALIMASSISTTPELALEVCPNIPKRLVAYFLNNYETDQNMAQKIDGANFMKHFNIPETPIGKPYDQVIQPLKLIYVEWSCVCQDCDFTKWNSLPKMDTTVTSYSFFGKYIHR